MGQIKNIKLHIVTDIKLTIKSDIRRMSNEREEPGESFEECLHKEDKEEENEDDQMVEDIEPLPTAEYYDPDIDKQNEQWMADKRCAFIPKQAPTEGVKDKKCKSDAMLNCPACLSTVCLDCQRHEKYKTQYRAMFVLSDPLPNLTRRDLNSERNVKKSEIFP